METTGHNYTCETCGKVATFCLESPLQVYKIDNKGGFTKHDTYADNEAQHYCKKCCVDSLGCEPTDLE